MFAVAASAPADAQHRGHRGGRTTTVITQPATQGIDISTLLLLGALGGNGNAGLTAFGNAGVGISPLALIAPQLFGTGLIGTSALGTQTTIIESGRRGHRHHRQVPAGALSR